MSEEEEYYEEGEEEEEEEEGGEEENEEEEGEEEDDNGEKVETTTAKSAMSEGEEILARRNEAKKGELDEQLKETINEWRKQRAKEEEELKKLKEQQARRKEIRAEQEVRLAKQKKEEEEKIRAEEAEKKAKRLEEAEKKRQAMVTAQKEKQEARGMVVEHKMPPVNTGGHKEVTKTKAQPEEEKKVCLILRIKPIDLEGLETEQLKSKASELWETVIRLETEKYDLEERGKRQGHDLKVLNERQIQRLRLKAVRMGL